MNVKILLPKNRGSGVTILGAIGNCLTRAAFIHGCSTNKEKVEELLRLVRLNCEPPLSVPVYVVLDNHTAHHSK